ncbi:MAG: hypothetical protein H8E74_12240 [Gammaproteobacteria bacterium]|nr:hypothetical protein [Gammaproteobacteria bacterium]
MKYIIDWHRDYSLRNAEYFKQKFNISDYGILWIAFAKGVVLTILLQWIF